MRKLTTAFLVLAALALLPVSADGCIITGYEADIQVGLDNVCSVSESISVDFHRPMRGIFREIPVGYLDGKKAIVSDLAASRPCEVYEKTGSYLKIRFGTEDRTLTGPQTYDLSYSYDLGADQNDGYDEFYYNLVGEGWQETIGRCRFVIGFPKPIDSSKIWVNRGEYGAVSSFQVYWNLLDERTVEVAAENMRPGEELTLRIELPDGYFVGARRAANWTPALFAFLVASSLVAIGLCALIWRSCGKDKVPVFTALSAPPDGMTPMQMGYLADYSVDDKDITSMIFYWADKGLLRIDEKKKGKFVFTKTGEPSPEALAMERNLFKWFFDCGSGGVVTNKDLGRGFYEKMERTKGGITAFYRGKRALVEPKSRIMQAVCLLIGLVPVLLADLLLTWDFIGPLTLLLALGGALLLMVQFALVCALFNRWHTARAPKALLVVLTFAPTLLLAIFAFRLHSAFGILALRTAGAVFALVAEGVVCFLAAATQKRSAYGQKLLEDVLGYREFLQKVEIDRLRLMIDSDPSLFYHNLSYAIVLGLEDEWADKFKGLSVQPPVWYAGRGRVCDALLFSSMARNFNNQIISAVMPRSSSSRSPGLRVGGSSFGGGGFSGGGFGGGGGGAW